MRVVGWIRYELTTAVGSYHPLSSVPLYSLSELEPEELVTIGDGSEGVKVSIGATVVGNVSPILVSIVNGLTDPIVASLKACSKVDAGPKRVPRG